MNSVTMKKSSLVKGVVGIMIIGLLMFTIITKFSGPTGAVVSNSGITEVTTTLQGFQYQPDTIKVKEGDLVKLTIQNKDNVNHGLHLPQFGVVDSIPAGTTKYVEFTAIETPTNGQAVPTCSQEHGETLTIIVEV